MFGGNLTDQDKGLERIFRPLPQTVIQANISPTEYEAAMKRGEIDFEGFWEEAAEELDWFKKWDKVLDRSGAPFYRWFVGAKCNIVYNALDRHIETRIKNKVAIIWEGEPGDMRKLTYYELYRKVNKFANVLTSLDVKKGDTVAIYLPNIPETAIAMLATAKIGGVHNVIFTGFSAMALRDRLKDADARVLVTADGFYRNGKVVNLKAIVDEALEECPGVETVVVVKRIASDIDMIDGRDLWYHELVDVESPEVEIEVMDSEDPLFIVHTSGTTDRPKGVVHVHGSYMVGVYKTFQWIFDIKETDIYWCAVDIGWITGHSYGVYAPLMAGATTVMYEGHVLYPKADRMWSMVEKYGINILYTSPTIIRMLRRFGSHLPLKWDLSTLRLLGSVGEPISPEAWLWYYKNVGKENCPIVDTWFQTETGMIMISPLPVSLLKPGSVGKPFPGVLMDVVDTHAKSKKPGEEGFLIVKNPWPAMFTTLYKDPQRYREIYWEKFPGYYYTGDMAKKDADGYIFVRGRADEVLNIGGQRVGALEMERALRDHKAVEEAAVVGIPDRIKGEVAKAFVVLKKGIEDSDDLINELKNKIRHELGSIAILKTVEFVESLPKTSSGEIMRHVLKTSQGSSKEAE